MTRKSALLSLSTLALLASCALPPGFQYPQTQIQPPQQLSRFSQKPMRQHVETLVSQERMEKNLGALSGKMPVAPNTFIPERGTVNGRGMTKTFISNYLKGLGYEVEMHEYRRNGANVMATLKAEEPTDEYILVGAHMDSVRNAGADDNASGSTAVLEAATVLKELQGRKVNIIFAWFDEEELGLIGSRYLARDLRKQKMNLTSVHTIDMMGWDGDGDKTVEVARPMGVLWDYYRMVNETHGLDLPLDRTNTGSSDHVAFSREGFDSLCLSEEWTSRDTTPHYHRRSDKFETINFEFLATGTRLLVAAVGDLALKVPPPANIQFVPHENFPAREREFHKSYDEHFH